MFDNILDELEDLLIDINISDITWENYEKIVVKRGDIEDKLSILFSTYPNQFDNTISDNLLQKIIILENVILENLKKITNKDDITNYIETINKIVICRHMKSFIFGKKLLKQLKKL